MTTLTARNIKKLRLSFGVAAPQVEAKKPQVQPPQPDSKFEITPGKPNLKAPKFRLRK